MTSQNATARISDFKQKRDELYYPYSEEMVDKALLKVAEAKGTNITRNLVHNKGWLVNMLKSTLYLFSEFHLIEIVTEQELKKEEMGMICSEMNSLLRQSHAVKTFSNFGEAKFKFKANFIFKNEAEIIWLLGSRLFEFSSFTYFEYTNFYILCVICVRYNR